MHLIRLDTVGSTNDEARGLALSGQAADFTVVVARRQTGGRGRRGRTWISPEGNLHCSILLDITGQLDRAAQIGFAAAVALVDALASRVPATSLRCKWPNDVLADGRKVAGMLLEPVESRWLVLGVGVDVAFAPPPEQVEFPAVSLSSLGYAGDAAAVLDAFHTALVPWVARWRQDGFAPIRQAWLERAQGLGGPVTVRLERESVTGTFGGLDADGALLLDLGSAERRRIVAGDVLFPAAG